MSRPEINTDDLEVVGFDLDHTLYPMSPDVDRVIQGYIYKEMAIQLGITLEEAEIKFHSLYNQGAGMSGGATLRALGVQGAKEIVQAALEHADVASTLDCDPETIRLLEDIKARYRNLDILTGSNKIQTTKKLGALMISASMFNHIIDGEVADKNSGEAYSHWLGLYPDFQPPQFLYVGDRAHLDHVIPSRMGIQTVLVNIGTIDSNLLCPQLQTLHDLRAVLL